MKPTGNLEITARGDREIVLTRNFVAKRTLVFAALTTPELIQRWLLGPSGWTMPVCKVDLSVGGAYRYVWRNRDGREMGMGGVYLEIVAPEKIVTTEKFDQPWYPGEAVNTLLLSEVGGTTTLTNILRYESQEARDDIIGSNMALGVGASYDRLDALIATRRPVMKAKAAVKGTRATPRIPTASPKTKAKPLEAPNKVGRFVPSTPRSAVAARGRGGLGTSRPTSR